jgi:hypothetical protein
LCATDSAGSAHATFATSAAKACCSCRTGCTASAALATNAALSTVAACSADACFSAVAASCSYSYRTYSNIQISIGSAHQTPGHSNAACAAVTACAASSTGSTNTADTTNTTGTAISAISCIAAYAANTTGSAFASVTAHSGTNTPTTITSNIINAGSATLASTAVAAVAADAQGRFELSAEAAGDYRLQITMVGYNPETQPVTLRTAATDAGTIRLRQGVDIDQVTVTIQKPLVTADAEKTTYSVEDDPQAASSTLEEILRKVPQLTIDAEGNVKLNGQSDFKVLVNGRSSAMFKNFKDVIRSMPASQIKKIEVITEPSMKYDAEGAGGIINIITARKEFDGYNGSLNYNTGLDTRQQYGGASLSADNLNY